MDPFKCSMRTGPGQLSHSKSSPMTREMKSTSSYSSSLSALVAAATLLDSFNCWVQKNQMLKNLFHKKILGVWAGRGETILRIENSKFTSREKLQFKNWNIIWSFPLLISVSVDYIYIPAAVFSLFAALSGRWTDRAANKWALGPPSSTK